MTPLNAAGMRIEPAVSEPSVPAASPAAAATPLPPDEPPRDPLPVPRRFAPGRTPGLVVIAP